MATKLKNKLSAEASLLLEIFSSVGASSLKDLVITLDSDAATLIPQLEELVHSADLEKHITNIGGVIFRLPVGRELGLLSAETLDHLMAIADTVETFTVSSLHAIQSGSLRLSKSVVLAAIEKLHADKRIKMGKPKVYMGNTYNTYFVA